jgi:ATP-dependent Clp protease adaptor protein ClpS
MAVKELVLPKIGEQEHVGEGHKLVLYNDDFNTFDWVIESLVEVCGHTHAQAEQCAIIVHYKGKYAVLGGSFDFLLPRRRALEDRGLSCTVE